MNKCFSNIMISSSNAEIFIENVFEFCIKGVTHMFTSLSCRRRRPCTSTCCCCFSSFLIHQLSSYFSFYCICCSQWCILYLFYFSISINLDLSCYCCFLLLHPTATMCTTNESGISFFLFWFVLPTAYSIIVIRDVLCTSSIHLYYSPYTFFVDSFAVVIVWQDVYYFWHLLFWYLFLFCIYCNAADPSSSTFSSSSISTPSRHYRHADDE